MSAPTDKAKSPLFFVALVAGLALVAGALWWLALPSVPEPVPRPEARAAPAAPSPAEMQAAELAPQQEPLGSGEKQSEDEQLAAVSAPPASEEQRQPHPITDQHERIFRENNLVGAMNGAMDVGDYQALRRMNAQYKADYPEDGHVLQQGYDLIADCLEQNTEGTRARAEQFWRLHKASQLRRYVRRHCLGGKLPSAKAAPG